MRGIKEDNDKYAAGTGVVNSAMRRVSTFGGGDPEVETWVSSSQSEIAMRSIKKDSAMQRVYILGQKGADTCPDGSERLLDKDVCNSKVVLDAAGKETWGGA